MIRLEPYPLLCQLRPQVVLVVDTPVEHNGHDRLARAEFVCQLGCLAGLVRQVGAQALAVVHHGLVAALVVEDAQAAMHERDVHHRAIGACRTIAESALAVGAAMLDALVQHVEPRLGDGLERVGGRRARFVDAQNAGDAAHGGGL